MLFNAIEVILWYICVLLCFIMAILFFLEYKNRDGFTRPLFSGIGIFAFCYTISRLLENIRRYNIGSYNDIYQAWLAGEQITGINFILRMLYIVISWFGIILLYYNIEKHIFTNNKYLLTIFSFIEGTLTITYYLYFNPTTFWLSVFIFLIPAYFLPILFLNSAKKASSKYVRNGCILTAIGVILFTTAVIIDLPEYAYVNYYYGVEYPELLVRIFSPIMLSLGIIFFTIGLKTHFQK